MATRTWLGTAAPIAQVQTFTFAGTWEADDIIRATIGTKTYDFTAGSTVTATVVSTLVTNWNALSSSSYPEFAEMTASANTADFILTADTAGKPFTVTLTPLEAGGGAADAQTIEGAGTATTGTETTASAGPNHWDTADNWSGATVPTTNDTVNVENSTVSIFYGLSNAGDTLTVLNVASTFTGKIGLPNYTGSYAEYRTKHLTLSATTLNIGAGTGQGSGRLKFNVGSNACTLNIYKTASGTETGLEAVLWKGTHASNVVNVLRGSVGIAVESGDTATVATLRVGSQSSASSDAQVRLGSGTTLTTINQDGGIVEVNGAFTTLTKTGGTTSIKGTGTVTTATLNGDGVTYYESTGTLTTANVRSKSILNFTRDLRARTVTNANCAEAAEIIDTFQTVTWTNGIDVLGSTAKTKIDLGTYITITPSAV